ncbi:hypothetical protein LES22_32200, partial [Pseudomonas aeruginosa]|uniref:hypothetical protein n=1 Tax=Pseudomonas aeruginosa TaxID=287 RepID=UPI003896C2ED
DAADAYRGRHARDAADQAPGQWLTAFRLWKTGQGRFSAPSSQALVLPSRVRSPAIYGAANRSA